MNTNKRANKIQTSDKNGIYSKDGRIMFYPFVNDGVVTVKKGVQSLSYSISNAPSNNQEAQLSKIRKIVFEEGVEKILDGWQDLYDRNSECQQRIDISLPSTTWKVSKNAFGDMVNIIRHIYVPRRYAKRIKSYLPENLIDRVKIDRIFFTRKSELLQNPTGNLIGFLGPADFTFRAIPIYILSIIAIAWICLWGHDIYLNTFLPFHLGLGSLLVFIFILVGSSYLEKSISAKRKAKNKDITFSEHITNWCVFIYLIISMLNSAVFIINDHFGAEQQESQGDIYAITKYTRRHTHTPTRILEIKLPNSDNITEVIIGTDASYDNVTTCQVYYHKGLFGWLVTDSISH